MPGYNGLSDDYYVNLSLTTQMELPSNRETVLHYFEQLKKRFPTMENFYSRDRSDFVLEEDKQGGSYRWATVERSRLASGYVNPPELPIAFEQHLDVLDLIPYSLSVSPLDCETLNLMYGFDFTYSGNHHELLADTFGMSPVFESFRRVAGGQLLSFDPCIQLALDDDCRTQCRMNIECRTTAYQVRNEEYPEEQLTVYLTIRRYGGLDPGETYRSCFEKLMHWGQELLDSHVSENILLPLKQAIAIK